MQLHKLKIQNFKAFKTEEVIDFEGKNALIFGNNGSGKSSLHYALHVFLQSSIPGKNFSRYFDKYDENGGNESLLNVYADPAQLPYKIELQLKTNANEIFTYQLKKEIGADTLPSTDATIELSDFSSDFISHRLLVNFYNFRNSESANIWLLVEKEVFPYWKDDISGKTLSQLKKEIEEELKELSEARERNVDTGNMERKYKRSSNEYQAIIDKVYAFNKKFTDIYTELLPRITTILNEFLPHENLKIDIKYWDPWDTDITYDWLWNKPQLNLELKVNEIRVPKVHTFLNEARLTALALSIRLAMFERRFKGTTIGDVWKVLVLDDLLVSLDMDFRMRFINYIYEQQKADGSLSGYQIILLTHEKGLFNILKNALASNLKKWKWFELFENNQYPITNPDDYKNPIIIEDKDLLMIANEYLNGVVKTENNKQIVVREKSYELCALFLRKKVEQILKRFYDPDMENIFKLKILETLERGLASVEKETNAKIKTAFEKLFNKQITVERIKELREKNIDIPVGSEPDIQKEINEANSLKNSLLTYIEEYQKDFANNQKNKQKLISLSKSLQEIRGRILNTGAHANNEILYELELKGAIQIIIQFEKSVDSSLIILGNK
jgi:hypothetical protein